MTDRKQCAVVLIHGIGELEPGDVLKAAKGALSGADGDSPPGKERAGVTRTEDELEWRGVDVQLIEFHWALTKIRLSKPFAAIRMILETIGELPLVGTIGSRSKCASWVARAMGRLAQCILVAMTALGVAAVVEDLVRHEDYAQFVLAAELQAADLAVGQVEGDGRGAGWREAASESAERGAALAGAQMAALEEHSFWVTLNLLKLALYVCMFQGAIVLLIATPLAISRFVLGSLGAATRAKVLSKSLLLRAVAASLLLAVLLTLVIVLMSVVVVQTSVMLLHPDLYGSTGMMMALGYVILFVPLLLVVILLANLFRDVIHYLAPARGGGKRPHQKSMLVELKRLAEDLVSRRLDRIVFVTHSLGTVIVTDMLRDWRSTSAGHCYPPVDLVTAGSPLRRLIGRLLPTRLSPVLITPGAALEELRTKLGNSEGLKVERWFNVYRVFDYIGQALTHSAWLRLHYPWKNSPEGDPHDGIAEQLLCPWPPWRRFGHSNYWGDRRFRDFLERNVLNVLAE